MSMFGKLINKSIIRFHIFIKIKSLHIAKEIKIPNKIYRDELTVLKALASCVEKEVGPPPFSFIDDPFLTPNDYSMRKRYLFSKASGKLSARIAFNDIKQEFIKVASDEPKIKCIYPLLSPTDIKAKVQTNEITVEKALFLLINLLKPKEAWEFYNENKDFEFSSQVIQHLLELLCAFSDSKTDFDITPEELFFQDQSLPIWRLDTDAELLFNSLQLKSALSYETMVRGASKFNNPTRALELHRECQSIHPSHRYNLKTYHTLLRSLRFSDLSDHQLQSEIIDILKQVSRHYLGPSVITFNSAIFAWSTRTDIEFLERIYGEMKHLGIVPTLGTFSVILQCSTLPVGILLKLAESVLQQLEKRVDSIAYESIETPDDVTLFASLIRVFRTAGRADLGWRLDRIVWQGGRIHLLGNDVTTGFYCDNLIKLLIAGAGKGNNIDLMSLFKILNKVVPGHYILQPGSLDKLIGLIRQATGKEKKLVADLLYLVNWSNLKNIEIDAFQKILAILCSIDIGDDEEYQQQVVMGLDLLIQRASTRKTSVLHKRDNVLAVIDFVHTRLGGLRRDLLWKLVDYASEKGLMTPSQVLKLVDSCLANGELDRLVMFLDNLSHLVTKQKAEWPPEEIQSFSEAVRVFRQRVLPVLEKNCINTGEFLSRLEICESALSENSESSSSTDGSSSDSD